MAFVIAGGAPEIGRVHLYASGNDNWTYQRAAYRIVLQQYWLEGGSPVFYFQPFYRWIAGAAHSVFGDSSVGERFWDGMCLLAGAMLAFRVTRGFAGFRWAILAAALSLAVFALGTANYLLGLGLSEVSSAGLVSMAALWAMRSRAHGVASAAGAGILATLAFYTRMNNLFAAAGAALFAVPLALSVRHLPDRVRWRGVAWPTIAIVGVTLAAGLLLFAWRTWHYTGVFSVFYGTQRYSLAIWQPGIGFRAILARIAESILIVLTVNDPPRFDVVALPVLAGAIVACLSVLGVPRMRDIPAAGVLYFAASIASAFVVYGHAYPGRFSVHVLPITSALAVCGVAVVSRAIETSLHRGGRRTRIPNS
jgi:hypothetical protein